uniref:Secreted protein n=1 Tax=Ixodes ricinus TaxID=34613 RepID=A0A6B0U8M9_IXORI
MRYPRWPSCLAVLELVVVPADLRCDPVWPRSSSSQFGGYASACIAQGVEVPEHRVPHAVLYWLPVLVVVPALKPLGLLLVLQRKRSSILHPQGQVGHEGRGSTA